MIATPKTDGVRKAAIVVASLDSATAELVLQRMPAAEAHQVRHAVAELGPIDADEQQRVIEEFCRLGPMVPDRCPSGIELDDGLARQFVPPPHGPLRSPPGGRSSPVGSDGAPAADPPAAPFGFLREAETDKLLKLLTAERPQVIALVLSHLSAEQSASVLVRLPPDTQADVVRRLVDLEEADPEILRDVERGLQQRLAELVQVQRRRVAGLSAVAGILEAAEQPIGMQILDNVAQHDRALAERLRPGRLDFADLLELDDRSLAHTVSAADRELVVLALVGAPPEWIARFLRLLPASESRLVRDALDHPGPTRLSDVEEARRRLAEVARKLALEGKIDLSRSSRTAVLT